MESELRPFEGRRCRLAGLNGGIVTSLRTNMLPRKRKLPDAPPAMKVVYQPSTTIVRLIFLHQLHKDIRFVIKILHQYLMHICQLSQH